MSRAQKVKKIRQSVEDQFRTVADYLRSSEHRMPDTAGDVFDKRYIGRLSVDREGQMLRFDFRARGLHITGSSFRGSSLSLQFEKGNEHGLNRAFNRTVKNVAQRQADERNAAAQQIRQQPAPVINRGCSRGYMPPQVA